MRRFAWLVLMLLFCPLPAHAKTPRCPLTLDACIGAFGHMRHQPWLGVRLETDSLGARVVEQLIPGGVAERAGVRVGDVVETLDGQPSPKFLAGRAGWKVGQSVAAVVRRSDGEHRATLAVALVSDDELAHLMGEHLVEAHLAYMTPASR
jgi:C-terminal processing protease CtpA/Prc